MSNHSVTVALGIALGILVLVVGPFSGPAAADYCVLL